MFEGVAAIAESYDSHEIVVLTTHERSAYFTAALGEDADMRFNPRQEHPLDDLLHNIILSGGKLVIIDEAFFIKADDMAYALERFVQNEQNSKRLKIIVVCADRKPGDPLLAFLVMYCGIHNIIYDSRGVNVTLALQEAIGREADRSEVLHLAKAGKWDMFKRSRDSACAGLSGNATNRTPACAPKGFQWEGLINLGLCFPFRLRISLEPILAGRHRPIC